MSIWAATWQNQRNDSAPSEDSDQPGHPPSLSESSLCAQCIAKDPIFLHADSEDSDQTGWMSRLIRVFAGRWLILMVLSCRGSYRGLWQQGCQGTSVKQYYRFCKNWIQDTQQDTNWKTWHLENRKLGSCFQTSEKGIRWWYKFWHLITSYCISNVAYENIIMEHSLLNVSPCVLYGFVTFQYVLADCLFSFYCYCLFVLYHWFVLGPIFS